MTTGLATPAQFKRVRMLTRQMARPAPWECPDPVELALQAGIELDDWQQEMVCSRALLLAANCSRQVGKSTAAALLAMHTALSEDNALVLIVAPSLRQSAELARSCKGIYGALGRPIRPVRESILSIELANGSRVISLPGTEDTIRGFASVRLIIIDEAARTEDGLYFSIKPMVAVSGGRIVTLSTPRFEIGWWWDIVTHHRQDLHYIEIPASSCKRIAPEFLESERESMGIWWYEMEYECKFQTAAGAAFRSEDIDRIIGRDIETWLLS